MKLAMGSPGTGPRPRQRPVAHALLAVGPGSLLGRASAPHELDGGASAGYQDEVVTNMRCLLLMFQHLSSLPGIVHRRSECISQEVCGTSHSLLRWDSASLVRWAGDR